MDKAGSGASSGTGSSVWGWVTGWLGSPVHVSGDTGTSSVGPPGLKSDARATMPGALQADFSKGHRVSHGSPPQLMSVAQEVHEERDLAQVLRGGLSRLARDWQPDKATMAFHEVCRLGWGDELAWLLQRGVKIDSQDAAGQTALLIAAQNGNADLVRQLCNAGADVNFVSRLGQTPLLGAVACNAPQLVSMLIEKGASVGQTDDFNWTPLMNAAAKGQVDCARVLLLAGSNKAHHDSFGRTALSLAVEAGHAGMTCLLLANSQDQRFAWSEELLLSPLDMATIAGGEQGRIVDLLDARRGRLVAANQALPYLDTLAQLEQSEQVRQAPSCRLTGKEALSELLATAASAGHVDVLLILLEAGADLSAAVLEHDALAMAVQHGHVGAIALLLAELSRRQAMQAQWLPDLNIDVRGMLEDQARLDLARERSDRGGRSLFTVAAIHNRAAAIVCLLNAGLDDAGNENITLSAALDNKVPNAALIDLLLCVDPAATARPPASSSSPDSEHDHVLASYQAGFTLAGLATTLAQYMESIPSSAHNVQQPTKWQHAAAIKQLCGHHRLRYVVAKALLDRVDDLSTERGVLPVIGWSESLENKPSELSEEDQMPEQSSEERCRRLLADRASYGRILEKPSELAQLYSDDLDVDTALTLTSYARWQVEVLTGHSSMPAQGGAGEILSSQV